MTTSTTANPLKLKTPAQRKDNKQVHVYGKGVVCATEPRGHATPNNLNPLELWLHAPAGVVPLWEKGMTLRWRFNDTSMRVFENPDGAKAEIQRLLTVALQKWGTAAPIKFSYSEEIWDFQIYMMGENDCDANGCVLASAFFPDSGRHYLRIYPKMFEQNQDEQVDTLVHEIGHTFGLRHWFAELEGETVPFGDNEDPFSIMNYGDNSKLTDQDKTDLVALYRKVWDGSLTRINGTPIRLVKPFSSSNA